MEQPSDFIKNTWLGDECSITYGSHCVDCDEYGFCDSCYTFEGRDRGAISDYASTCDGCYWHTHHAYLKMDPQTQLGYCEECLGRDDFDPEILARIKAFIEAGEPQEMICLNPLALACA